MADARALEEEGERMNPINPKSQIGSRQGYTGIVRGGAMVGAGATPSMGLSTKRGGRKSKGKAMEDMEEMTDEEDIVGMGRALASHLHSLHGGGFLDEFQKGFSSVVRPVGGARMCGEGQLTIQHGGARMSGGAETGAYQGEGMLTIQHGGARPGRKTKEEANKLIRSVAQVPIAPQERDMGRPTPDDVKAASALMKLKKGGKRAPAGPSDARRKRGAMVSRLMKEKGMTLGEASKHIKEHGMD
jgi:hypothetical protein